jgi:hypothetical protein
MKTIKTTELGKITQKMYGEYPWSSGLEVEFVYRKTKWVLCFSTEINPRGKLTVDIYVDTFSQLLDGEISLEQALEKLPSLSTKAAVSITK